MAGNEITFDDVSTGISYEVYPKDPAAREAIAIVNNKVEELKDSVVSKQNIISLENKVKQSGLDTENFKTQVNKEVKGIKDRVDGLDGGSFDKINELETAVNKKADKNVVDSLLDQIEGSVKQINGVAPDGNGNVIIDLDTQNMVGKPEFEQKTDELSMQLYQTELELNNAKDGFPSLKEKLDNLVVPGGGGTDLPDDVRLFIENGVLYYEYSGTSSLDFRINENGELVVTY